MQYEKENDVGRLFSEKRVFFRVVDDSFLWDEFLGFGTNASTSVSASASFVSGTGDFAFCESNNDSFRSVRGDFVEFGKYRIMYGEWRVDGNEITFRK